MKKQTRQLLGLASAVVLYYLIHEGAHLAMALRYGVFEKIRFLGIGVQVVVDAKQMTDTQIGFFCLIGVVATAVAGWLLVLLRGKICRAKSPVFRAVMWYTSMVMLLLDPLYLSILCSFVGGGDMNGIALLVPELAARLAFAAMAAGNGWVVWKILLPEYTRSFENKEV